jgi:hypothetical protein
MPVAVGRMKTSPSLEKVQPSPRPLGPLKADCRGPQPCLACENPLTGTLPLLTSPRHSLFLFPLVQDASLILCAHHQASSSSSSFVLRKTVLLLHHSTNSATTLNTSPVVFTLVPSAFQPPLLSLCSIVFLSVVPDLVSFNFHRYPVSHSSSIPYFDSKQPSATFTNLEHSAISHEPCDSIDFTSSQVDPAALPRYKLYCFQQP